jgi:hypothetical protein
MAKVRTLTLCFNNLYWVYVWSGPSYQLTTLKISKERNPKRNAVVHSIRPSCWPTRADPFINIERNIAGVATTPYLPFRGSGTSCPMRYCRCMSLVHFLLSLLSSVVLSASFYCNDRTVLAAFESEMPNRISGIKEIELSGECRT